VSTHEAHGDGLLGSDAHCGTCGEACENGWICREQVCSDPDYGSGGV
jgi:hypothetical protein